MATAATQSSENLARQAIAAWESAIESSVKMQEESARWLREAIGSSNSLTEWYKKGQAITEETVAKAEATFGEALQVLNQQAESGVRLLQKARDARHGDAACDATAQCAQWWETAMVSMQTNSQALLTANSRILSTWSELARKIHDDAADAMSHLAQTTTEHAERMAQSAVANAKSMVKPGAGE